MNKNKKRFWIGFDLGGTKMQATIFDEKFKRRARARKKTKGHEGTAAGLRRAVDVIQEALGEAGIVMRDVAGIGVGCAGPLDLEKGVIIEAPNLGWKNAHIRAALEKHFRCPVVISNDVDAGTYGEYCFGAARKARCAVGIFPGTGIGGGCVYEGRVLQGRRASCMEVGHLKVLPDGPICGCGQRGCLEAVASRLAISAALAAAAYRGEAPALRRLAGTDLSNIRSGVIAEAIGDGDKRVEEIVRSAAAWLGHGVAMLVNLLGPDVVVLGGGLVEAMPKLFVEEVERAASRLVMRAFLGHYRVAAAQLGDDATAAGAAAWAREQIESGRI